MLLTEDEAAARLQICGRTLRKERQAGNVRYILIGRCVRYHPDDLAELVAAKRTVERPMATGRKGSGKRKVAPTRGSGVIVPFSERQRRRQ